MKTRHLTEAERAEIEARYGVKCDVTTVTVYKLGQHTPFDDIQSPIYRKMKAARERVNRKK